MTTTENAVGAVALPAAELKDAVDRIKPAIARASGSALPVLQGVRIAASGRLVTFTATDLDLTLEQTVELPVEATDFTVVVPGAVLGKFAMQAKKDKAIVTIAPGTPEKGDDNEHPVNLWADDFKLEARGVAADEWPAPQLDSDPQLVPLDLDALCAVAFAAGDDDSRPILTSVRVGAPEMPDADNWGAEYVSTDSYRLAIVQSPIDCGITKKEHFSPYSSILIPAKAVAQVEKHLDRLRKGKSTFHGELTAEATERDITLAFEDGFTLRTRTIEGAFPNYASLVRQTSTPGISGVDLEELAATTERIDKMGSGSQGTPIRIQATDEEGTLRLVLISQENGTVSREIPGVFNPDAEGLALNPAFLVSVLKPHVKGHPEYQTDTIEAVDTLKPAIVRDDAAFGNRAVRRINLLMPVRVS